MESQHPDIESPPLDPAGEILLANDAAFIERCMLLVEKFTSNSSWQFDRGLLTRSREWGLVWRGDYADAGLATPHLINRIMCWEGADRKIIVSIAVGQRIAPLPAGPIAEPERE
jgi:hypothetical protein